MMIAAALTIRPVRSSPSPTERTLSWVSSQASRMRVTRKTS